MREENEIQKNEKICEMESAAVVDTVADAVADAVEDADASTADAVEEEDIN